MIKAPSIKDVRNAVRRSKELSDRMGEAMDRIIEPFLVQLSRDTRTTEVPDGFLTELILTLVDQAGFSVETGKEVAAALRKGALR